MSDHVGPGRPFGRARHGIHQLGWLEIDISMLDEDVLDAVVTLVTASDATSCWHGETVAVAFPDCERARARLASDYSVPLASMRVIPDHGVSR